jgi:hypothetical protein
MATLPLEEYCITSFDWAHGDDYVYHGTTSFRGLHQQDLLQLSDEQQKLYGKDMLHEVFPEYYLIKVNKFEEIRSDFKAKGIKRPLNSLRSIFGNKSRE